MTDVMALKHLQDDYPSSSYLPIPDFFLSHSVAIKACS